MVWLAMGGQSQRGSGFNDLEAWSKREVFRFHGLLAGIYEKNMFAF